MMCDVTTNVFKRVERINLIKIEIEATRKKFIPHRILIGSTISLAFQRRRRQRRYHHFSFMNFYCFFFSIRLSLVNPRNGKQGNMYRYTLGIYTTHDNNNVLDLHNRYEMDVQDGDTHTDTLYETLWLNITVEWHSAQMIFFSLSPFVIHWSGLSGAKIYSMHTVFINWQNEGLHWVWITMWTLNTLTNEQKSIVNLCVHRKSENGVYLWYLYIHRYIWWRNGGYHAWGWRMDKNIICLETFFENSFQCDLVQCVHHTMYGARRRYHKSIVNWNQGKKK